MAQRHLRAFNRAVKARALDTVDLAAPVVELGRDLARALDSEGVSARAVSSYRAVLRELRRYEAAVVPAAPGTGAEPEKTGAEPLPIADLSAFKSRRGSSGS